MYEVLRNYLTNGNYTIADGQARIDYAVARGNISPEEATELTAIVTARGTQEAITTKSLDERVTDIEAAIIDLGNMLAEIISRE